MTELSKNRQGPDATQVMMLKNDVIKEKHKRSLQRLKQDRQRTTENLEEQVSDGGQLLIRRITRIVH